MPTTPSGTDQSVRYNPDGSLKLGPNASLNLEVADAPASGVPKGVETTPGASTVRIPGTVPSVPSGSSPIDPNADPNATTSYFNPNTLTWMPGTAPPADQMPKTDDKMIRDEVAASNQARIDGINAKAADEMAKMATTAANNAGSTRAAAARNGLLGSTIGDERISEDAQKSEDARKAYQLRLDAAITGSLQGNDERVKAAQTAAHTLAYGDPVAMEKQNQAMLTGLEIQAKYDEGLEKTLQQFVDSGIQPNETQFKTMNTLYHTPSSGMAELAYAAKVASKAKADAKDLADRKTKALDLQVKIMDWAAKAPIGSTLTVDGYEYTGQNKGDVVSGIQVNSDTGEATYWQVNRTTGERYTAPMGQMGAAKDGWQVENLGEKGVWRVNPHTGQAVPFYPSEGQVTHQAVVETVNGKPPTLPGHEANAGQCGAFANWCYGKPLLGDTFESKQVTLKNFEVKLADAQVGDTVLFKSGTTGHIAIINSIDSGPSGPVFRFTEANMVPPGGKQLSFNRPLPASDPSIAMVARVPTPNLPPVGPDSPVTSAALGNAPTNEVAVLGSGPKSIPDRLLSPTEAKALGVKYGTTEQQAAKMGIQPKAEIPADRDPNRVLSVNEAKDLGVPYGTTAAEAASKGIVPSSTSAKEKALTPNEVKEYMGIYPDAGIKLTDTAAQAQAKIDAAGKPPILGAGAKSKTEEEKPLTDAELTSRGIDLQDPEASHLTRANVDEFIARKKAENGGIMPLPPDQDSAARLISEYGAEINDVMKGRTQGEAERIMAQVRRYNPTFDIKKYQQRKATVLDFSTAGDSGKAINAVAKVVEHLKDLSASGIDVNKHRLFGNAGEHVPGFGIVGDVLARATHTAGRLDAYNENAQAVANELTKVFSGSGGNETEVTSWKDTTNDRNTNSENAHVIQKAIDLLAGQFKGMHDNYVRVMGEEPEAFIGRSDLKALAALPGIDGKNIDVSKLERYSLGKPPTGSVWVTDSAGKIYSIAPDDPDIKNYIKL